MKKKFIVHVEHAALTIKSDRYGAASRDAVFDTLEEAKEFVEQRLTSVPGATFGIAETILVARREMPPVEFKPV